MSDTRTEADDRSGQVMAEALAAAGHSLALRKIVPDEPTQIRAGIEEALAAGVRAVILSGGTGLTARDTTYEVVSGMIERPLPGFGELFRMLSFAEIGSAAMLSRATAGVIGRAVVFALPGSSKGVRLGMERLIVPELAHVVQQVDRE